MIDPLSIFVYPFLDKVFDYLAKKIRKFNDSRKSKKSFRDWMDFYRSEGEPEEKEGRV